MLMEIKKKRLSPPKEPNTYKIWFTGVPLNYGELVNESGHTLCLDIWSTLHTAMISSVESIACKLDCKILSSWVWLIVGDSVFFFMPYTWKKEYRSVSNNPAKKITIIFNIVAYKVSLHHLSWWYAGWLSQMDLPCNKGSKCLKKLWCCVSERVYQSEGNSVLTTELIM